jgi:hypothetical protein
VRLSRTISGRPSWRQRSSVSVRQIRPRAVPGHEVDRLGRDEFGRDDEVALVLAVFFVDQDDHRPALMSAMIRVLQRVRNQVDGEVGAMNVVGGQAGAIDGDGTLLRNVLGQCLRSTDFEQAIVTDGIKTQYLADAIDVAGDEVATEAVGQAQGLLHVDLARFGKADSAGQRFRRDVDAEAVALLLDHGQADTVAGDRVTERNIVETERAGLYGEADGVVFVRTRRKVGDAADGGHDAAGLPDFAGQAIAALAGVDTALVVINAQTGIELMTERMMRAWPPARKLCRMIVINKIDADNLDLPGLVADIRERFGKQCMLLDLPAHTAQADVVEVLEHDSGDADFESVAAAHRALIDQIVEEDETCSPNTSRTASRPERRDLHAPFEKALREGHLIPILFTSARPAPASRNCCTCWPRWRRTRPKATRRRSTRASRAM